MVCNAHYAKIMYHNTKQQNTKQHKKTKPHKTKQRNNKSFIYDFQTTECSCPLRQDEILRISRSKRRVLAVVALLHPPLIVPPLPVPVPVPLPPVPMTVPVPVPPVPLPMTVRTSWVQFAATSFCSLLLPLNRRQVNLKQSAGFLIPIKPI